ncbi:sugar O-acetyltransferase [Vibrio genomosp. F10]|uniref:Acetyltransferase n=1 Tax=Vibrio genomosp. F10 TaxID=723171 RepID=A0A1B9QZQ5_9VIBR|nr:sugar O-acetyltransferase [Vibrio genomosp. F10]OCH76700.1 acetyltransferase [Vibrio genomosp. F10]OEE96482.1 acetyltransferase [Vibrio genomosp. F10 str. 9ZC157]OEF10601.1 acetyltransferase [Vibrio genomosp. F10 str. 9ZB36]
MKYTVSGFEVQIPINSDLFHFQQAVKEKLYDFNHSRPSEERLRQNIMKEVLGSSNGVHIVPPFHCDMGKNIHFKEGGFLNYDVKILDLAEVTIGQYVQIGPNVVISTASHPLSLSERVLPVATANPITIGDNVWIGAGAVILDGVSIGDRCVIGAGSVVTKSIPADSVAVGSPCRVMKTITQGEMPTDQEIEEMWQEMNELE